MLHEAEWESGFSHCVQTVDHVAVTFILWCLDWAIHQTVTSHGLIYYMSSRRRMAGCWLALQVECGPVNKHFFMGLVYSGSGVMWYVLGVLVIWTKRLFSLESERVASSFSVGEFTQCVSCNISFSCSPMLFSNLSLNCFSKLSTIHLHAVCCWGFYK